jgi:hypothetical protein
MKRNNDLTPEQRIQVQELGKRFRENLKKRPEVSDEEFMAETEVSDEQYKMGLTLPGTVQD